MSSAPLPTAGFSPAESDLLEQYRTVSWPAVASLGLGAASCTVLFSWLLCWLPILAVALSLVAQRSIRQQPSRLIGRKAALGGLALALFFGTWGLTQTTVRRAILFRQARAFAQEWLELVQAGRLLEAHQLHLPRDSRQMPESPLAEFYRQDREARRSQENFFSTPPLKSIVSAGRQGQLRFTGDGTMETERVNKNRVDRVSQRFAIDYEQGGKPLTVEFFVTLARRLNPTAGEATWEVQSVWSPRAGES